MSDIPTLSPTDIPTTDDRGVVTIDGTRYIVLVCAAEQGLPDNADALTRRQHQHKWHRRATIQAPGFFQPVKCWVDIPDRGGARERILIPLSQWRAYQEQHAIGDFGQALKAAQQLDGVRVRSGPDGLVVSFDDAMAILKHRGIDITPFSFGARHAPKEDMTWVKLDGLRNMSAQVQIKDVSDE